jgi:hypothetical protein
LKQSTDRWLTFPSALTSSLLISQNSHLVPLLCRLITRIWVVPFSWHYGMPLSDTIRMVEEVEVNILSLSIQPLKLPNSKSLGQMKLVH